MQELNINSISIKDNMLREFEDVVERHRGILPTDWEKANLKKEIEALPNFVEFIEENGKLKLKDGDLVEDLRHLDFITVDPVDCRDMDDAVCCEIDENGDYILYTAIADVQRYFSLPTSFDNMEDKDTIGKVYLSGGYTMYSPFRAYGILPNALSDNLCSLMPNENRLAFVTKMTIDKNTGLVKGCPEIVEGIINSRAKLSYDDAQAVVDDDPYVLLDERINKRVQMQILRCKNCSDCIKKAFDKRGMINFPDEDEYRINVEDNEIYVNKLNHLDYQDVIENFMILTNEENARFAYQNNIDVIYRLHDSPIENQNGNDVESLIRLLKIMPLHGFHEDLESSIQFTPGTFKRIFDLVKNSKGETAEMYREFLSRIQTRAKSDVSARLTTCCDGIDGNEYQYSHFGLQSKYYIHITSPIRRITDYVNMKNILSFIQGKTPISKSMVKSIASWADIRREEVDNAEKEFLDTVASYFYQQNTQPVVAHLCDYDYRKNGYCVFKDDENGFLINVPIEKISQGFYIDQEKWGFLVNGMVISYLGQKEILRVKVLDNLSVVGDLEFSKVRKKDEVSSSGCRSFSFKQNEWQKKRDRQSQRVNDKKQKFNNKRVEIINRRKYKDWFDERE